MEGEYLGLGVPLMAGLLMMVMARRLFTRRFLASDKQEYKWSLTSASPPQWTCSTSHTNYFVASYEVCDGNSSPGGAKMRLFSVGDTWVHLVVGTL